MKIKCPACEDWEFDEDKLENWTACPNCDFPPKFASWIEEMKKEIAELKRDNETLRRSLAHEHSMRGWYK